MSILKTKTALSGLHFFFDMGLGVQVPAPVGAAPNKNNDVARRTSGAAKSEG